MRKKKEVLLSSFLKEQMMLNQKQVNLSGKGITQVDEISPFLCSQTQSLNLSNNKLVSITNLAQFSQLVQLDISSNKIMSCQELECLRNMVKLKKVYFSNNPFLSEPIEESLLELILQKQTDIEILSLQLIKEVQNQEIKIIFLKNYLSKIELHEELKRKANVETKTSQLKGEQLIQKIIPQFYAAIQSPKLLSSIKKQALTLKKQCRDSLEDALSKAKEMKSKKIDQLLKSIVDVIQDSKVFFEERSFTLQVNLNQNTISFSPEKRGRKEFNNTVRIQEQEQYSPVRYIEFSKDENTFEDITMTNLKPQPKERSPQLDKITHQSIHQNNFDVIETTRKQNSGFKRTPGRFSSFADFKESLQSKKKLSQNKYIPLKPEQRETSSKFKTPIAENKPAEPSTQYIRVIDSTQSEVYNSNKFSLHKPLSTNSPRNVNESNVSWKNMHLNAQELTPENIELIYYKTMTKLHPMFNLLHSPASSLNDQQKNTLIETLKTHHKETFSELLKQKASNQTIFRQREQARGQAAAILAQSDCIFRQNHQLKQEYDWIQNRFKCLQSDYAQLLVKYKELENAEKIKTTTISNIQTSYKKIKNCYTEKAEELMKLQKCDQTQQKIRLIREQNIRQRYFAQLISKAALWKNVLQREKQAKIKRQQQLCSWGVFSFKQNRLLHLAIKQKINRYHHKLTKVQFFEWKKETLFEKKSKKLQLLMNNKMKNEFLDLLKKNIPESRMAKLSKIQAARFYSEHKYKNYFSLWQDLYKRRTILNMEAAKLWSLTTCSRHFFAIKNLLEQRRCKMEDLQERLQANCMSRQIKKLIYLMKKQMIEIRESENKVRIHHQHCMRANSFAIVKQATNQNRLLKAKKASLLQYILSKKVSTFKRKHQKSQKRSKRFRNYCYLLRFQIIKRCLLKCNRSFRYADQLLNKEKLTFVRHLFENKSKRSTLRQNCQRFFQIRQKKLKFSKLKFMKGLYVLRLKGHNYVKKRAIQEMNFQMDINDQRALQLIKLGQQSIVKCQQEIIFLKGQIQAQSNRQIALLAENETLMLTFNESCEIMKELRKQVELIREESLNQQIRYNKLAKKYNEAVQILQRRQKKERLQQIIQGQQPN